MILFFWFENSVEVGKKKMAVQKKSKSVESKSVDTKPKAKKSQTLPKGVKKEVPSDMKKMNYARPFKHTEVPMPKMRNRNISRTEKDKLISLALVNPATTLEELSRKFRNETGLDISSPGICYHLAKGGLKKLYTATEDNLLEKEVGENPSKLMKVFSAYKDGVIDPTWKVAFLTPVQAILYAPSLELTITVNTKKKTGHSARIDCVSPNFLSGESRVVAKFSFDLKKRSVRELLDISSKKIELWKVEMDDKINQKLDVIEMSLKKSLHIL